MKKFKELLFLSNIARVNKAKIHNEFVPILSKYKTFDDLVDFLKKDYSDSKLEKALEKTDKILNQLADYVKIVTIFDKDYPEGLKDMGSKAPLFLYVIGNSKILNKPNIAIIGTRKPSLDTQNFEYKFTREIIERTERVIVSGLALGCDKIAHTAAVDDRSETIAFLPCGFNKIEPDTNKRLAGNIIENGGCLVSVFAPNVSSSEKNFNIRNEFVALASDCVLAMECSKESGTMNTVNFAKNSCKIATYLPDDTGNGDFTGNKYILNKIFNSFKISSFDDLEDFLEFLVSEDFEQKIVYKTKNEKQLTLKVNPNGQCTFEFE